MEVRWLRGIGRGVVFIDVVFVWLFEFRFGNIVVSKIFYVGGFCVVEKIVKLLL